MLTQNGYSVLMSVQNASGNGLDVLARAADGSLVALEVKATGRGTIRSLTSTQANSTDYVQKIILEAVTGKLRGQTLPLDVTAAARTIEDEVKLGNFRTVAVGVKLLGEKILVSKW